MEDQIKELSEKLEKALGTIEAQGKLIKGLQKQLAKKSEEKDEAPMPAPKPSIPSETFTVENTQYAFRVASFFLPGPNGAVKVLATDALLDNQLLESLVSKGSKAIKVVG